MREPRKDIPADQFRIGTNGGSPCHAEHKPAAEGTHSGILTPQGDEHSYRRRKAVPAALATLATSGHCCPGWAQRGGQPPIETLPVSLVLAEPAPQLASADVRLASQDLQRFGRRVAVRQAPRRMFSDDV